MLKFSRTSSMDPNYSVVPIPDNIELHRFSGINHEGGGGGGGNGNFSHTLPEGNTSYEKVLKDIKALIKEAIGSNDAEKLDNIRTKLSQLSVLFDPVEIKNGEENIYHYIARTKNEPLFRLFFPENVLRVEFTSIDNAKEMLQMNSKRGAEETPIHTAVKVGFVCFVEGVLQRFPDLVTVKSQAGHTLLHTAVKNSSLSGEICMNLIANYGTPNVIREMTQAKETANGQTPLHFLCHTVPQNSDANVLNRLKILTNGSQVEDVNMEWDKDENGKTPLHFLCCKVNQGKDYAKNENGKILLEALIQNRNRINDKTEDMFSWTPLHLAVINGFDNLVEVLVKHHAIDVTQKSGNGWMPIHYAAEKEATLIDLAIWTNYRKCLHHLVNWEVLKDKMKPLNKSDPMEPEDLFKRYLVEDTCHIIFNGKSQMHSALSLTCICKSAKGVELILRNLAEAKNPQTWFKGKENESSRIFSLRPVFKYTPDALKFLFDRAVIIDESNTNEITATFTTDISVLSGLIKPIRRNEVESEIKYLNYANEWPEDVQEKLLLHPLTQCTLHALWEQMKLFKLLWILGNVLWLAFYFILVPFEYEQTKGGKVLSHRGKFAASALGVLVLIRILYDSVDLISGVGQWKWKKVVNCLAINKFSWLQIVLTCMIIAGPCTGMHFLPNDAESFLGAVGVLLAFIMFWRNISFIYLPWGIQVEYLIQTLLKILLAILCFVPIIIGFERAFRQILPEGFSSTSLFAFVRTLVMMTGEFEYTEMFKIKEENATLSNDVTGENESAENLTFNLLAFVVFLLLLPIAFYNLVTGLVVDKIQQMEKKLEIKQILNHIRLINHIHRTHWSKFDWLCWSLPCLQPCYISYRFQKNGRRPHYDPELKWQLDRNMQRSSSESTLIFWEFAHWSKGCITSVFKGLRVVARWLFYGTCSLCGGGETVDINADSAVNDLSERMRCGNLLPESVKQWIYQLAPDD